MQSEPDFFFKKGSIMTSLITPDAIQSMFEHLGGTLPKYVPALPSIILGLIVMGVVVLISLVIAIHDRNRTSDETNFLTRTRWIVLILIGCIVGVVIGDFVRDKDYTIRCITDNRQHFANVHWLRLYSLAYRGKTSA